MMYHPFQMRRLLSISLILVWVLAPLAVQFQADDDVRLPACCRRNGAHHCAESMNKLSVAVAIASGVPIFTAPSTCPEYPGTAPMNIAAQHAVAASPFSLAVALSQSHSPASSRASARISKGRTRCDRGPPTSIPV